MNFCPHIVLLLVVTTTAVYTAAMTCDKMIWEKSSNENTCTGVANDVLEMGQYTVSTTRRTDSDEVQDLISTLDGASDIQYEHNSFTAILQRKDLNSFTAILQPKDLKKVLQTEQQFEVANIYSSTCMQLNMYSRCVLATHRKTRSDLRNCSAYVASSPLIPATRTYSA